MWLIILGGAVFALCLCGVCLTGIFLGSVFGRDKQQKNRMSDDEDLEGIHSFEFSVKDLDGSWHMRVLQ